MYKLWNDYVKLEYGKKAKSGYMDTCNFVVHVKADHIYKDIAKDVQARFEISNFEIHRPLLERKNKKVIGIMKDE